MASGTVATFSLRVLSVLEVPGRGLSVVGVVEAGALPRPGTTLSIAVEGRRPIEARLASGPTTEVHPPKVGFLLQGVSGMDVPNGALISAIERASPPSTSGPRVTAVGAKSR